MLQGDVLNANVLANDSDIENDVLQVTSSSSPIHGIVVVNANGDFTYTPDPTYSGTDTFTYTICDGNGGCADGLVTITIEANLPPNAETDLYSVFEDDILIENVAFNDTDPENDVLTFQVVSTPVHGVLNFNPDGTFNYIPDLNFNGTDSFVYEACDPFACSQATVTIEVLPVNDPPIIQDDNYIGYLDQDVTGNVTDNDTDVDGDILIVTLVDSVVNGTLVLNSDGSFIYTPNTGTFGIDGFVYQACDSSGACGTGVVTIEIFDNHQPVAVDDFYSTDEDIAVDGNVSLNDSDADNDPLTFTVSVDPANGTVVMLTDGSFTYTPNPNYNGTDTFVYEVCDDQGACNTATVFIDVLPVDDGVIANNDQYTTDEDTALSGNVSDNDINVDLTDTIVYTLITGTSNGVLLLNSDGTFTYNPDANWFGIDGFTYQMCDQNNNCINASVIIDVISINDLPVAADDSYTTDEDIVLNGDVSTNDFDVDATTLNYTVLNTTTNGILQLQSDGTFTYTPDANYSGSDAFDYVVCDNDGGCDTAHVDITIIAVDDAVVANDDNYTINEDSVLADNVSFNDINVDPADTITYTQATSPSNGTLIFNVDGSFTYTPDLNWNGNDSFDYQMCDQNGNCSSATVFIQVIPVNDPPIAQDDSYSVDEDNVLADNVSTNDTDPESDTLSYTVLSNPLQGDLVLNSDGTFTYTPNANYNGTDSFSYVVCDSQGSCDSALVNINVIPVDDPVVANDDLYTTDEDVVLNANVADNDVNVDLGDTITYTQLSATTNGVLVFNSDGSFTYTPDANWFGTDGFNYQMCDQNGNCSNATVVINVTSVNDNPVAIDDSYTMDEDTVLSGDVSINDSDVEGDPLTFTVPNQPINGAVVMNIDGTFVYTPNANYNGTDSFDYVVCDNQGGCDTALVVITILPVDDSVTANDDNYTINEDQVLNANVSDNDINVDLTDTITYTALSTTLHGVLVFNADGSFTYTPDANWFGVDGFDYQMCDQLNNCSNATVVINVISVNDNPVALDDAFTMNEDTVLTGDVSVNDSDVEGDPLSYNLLNQPTNGTVVFDTNGTFVYTPSPNYNGTDSFNYVVCDNNGGCDTALVNITIIPVDDPVVANDDTYSIPEDNALNANVSDNDINVDLADTITYTQLGNVLHGVLTFNSDGSFTYNPDVNWNGDDSFTYQMCDQVGNCDTALVTITVVPVNDAPVATDDSYTVNEDNLLNGNVSTNDTDPEGDLLTFTVLNSTINGTLVLNADGTFTYTPDLNYNGDDSFLYLVCDTQGACDTALVDINVLPVDDGVVANDDAYTTNEDIAVSGNVSDNDVNVDAGDVISYTIFTNPTDGTLVINADGTFIYTPNTNWNGVDTFTYQMCDQNNNCDTAVVTITVVPVNDPPVATDDTYTIDEDTPLIANVSLNDTDPDGDPLIFDLLTPPAHGTVVLNGDGSFTYNPANNYNGSDTFQYTACDLSNGCDTALVTITITPVNDAPVANDDLYSTSDTNILTGNVTDNDSDPEGDALTASLITNTTHGILTLNADGSFTYDADNGYVGTDSFEYQICDTGGLCDTAVVIIEVGVGNLPPVAVDDNYGVLVDGTLTANVGDNDFDPEGNNLTWSIVTTTTNGTTVFNNDGSFVYTPNTGYSGPDGFVYQVCDQFGACDTATVTILVAGSNQGPIANADYYTTNEDSSVSGNVSLNDSDPNGDVLTFNIVTSTTAGTVTFNNITGGFTFVGNPDFFGATSFIYQACDPFGLCDTAIVYINVTPVPDAPIAVDDAYSTSTNIPVSGDVSLNDINVDLDGLSYTTNTDPLHGTVILQTDGNFIYTPATGYNGVDSFTYIACNSSGLCDTAIVTITINPGISVNDDFFTTQEDTPVSGNATLNDTPNLTYFAITDPAFGSISFNLDGTFTYTPNQDFFGADSFNYVGCDGTGYCDTATVFITVTPVNDPPVDGNETVSVCGSNAVVVDVLANASDVDSQVLIVSQVVPSVGIATILPNGSISFTAPAGFFGIATVNYQVCDNAAVPLCVQSNITITVLNDLMLVTSQLTNPACHNDSNGSIDLNVTGGVGPYGFNWTNGPQTEDLNDVPAGDYTVTVSDLGGCAPSQTATYTLTEPAEITYTTEVVFDPCNDKYARIIVTPTGGNPDYIFIWDNLSATTGTVNNVPPGASYGFTLGDADGCTAIGSVTVEPGGVGCFNMPSGFSPDGDRVNDVLVIDGLDKFPGNNLKIFNRWGNLVYESTNYKSDWNGVSNAGGVLVGQKVLEGTYFYVIDLGNGTDPKTGYLIIKY